MVNRVLTYCQLVPPGRLPLKLRYLIPWIRAVFRKHCEWHHVSLSRSPKPRAVGQSPPGPQARASVCLSSEAGGAAGGSQRPPGPGQWNPHPHADSRRQRSPARPGRGRAATGPNDIWPPGWTLFPPLPHRLGAEGRAGEGSPRDPQLRRAGAQAVLTLLCLDLRMLSPILAGPPTLTCWFAV